MLDGDVLARHHDALDEQAYQPLPALEVEHVEPLTHGRGKLSAIIISYRHRAERGPGEYGRRIGARRAFPSVLVPTTGTHRPEDARQ